MKAEKVSCGLILTLVKVDKEIGEKQGKLECNLNSGPKVILHIVEEAKTRGPFENPGFHIIATPRQGGPRKRYDIYLSKERFSKLTNPEEDPIVKGGYFVSRSMYDRVEFVYYGV